MGTVLQFGTDSTTILVNWKGDLGHTPEEVVQNVPPWLMKP